MAQLYVTGGIEEITWEISGFDVSFDQTNDYAQAGIATSQVPTNGGTSAPSGIVDYVTAKASGGGNSTGESTVTRITAGSHTYYGYAKIKSNGKYWRAGSATVTVTAAKTRPKDWSWSRDGAGSVISGQSLSHLTAQAWNDFCSRINAFRDYHNLGAYGFSSANSGDTIYAWQIRQAYNAINSITNKNIDYLFNMIQSGQPIYGSIFTDLALALNDSD